MIPLTVLFIINLILIASLAIKGISKKSIQPLKLEFVRQIGMLALIWGILSTIIGLYQAFDSLSQIEEPLGLNIIMGGLRVALITAEYGMIIFLISLIGFNCLRLYEKKLSQ
ncbi:MAG: MotA/TolQ/ExbB proton channel family protein [Ignavibacterium sp.]|nr:MotA/TolQ/ExbB proton channel family protein [Ignavibacterium sp.]